MVQMLCIVYGCNNVLQKILECVCSLLFGATRIKHMWINVSSLQSFLYFSLWFFLLFFWWGAGSIGHGHYGLNPMAHLKSKVDTRTKVKFVHVVA